MKRVVFATRAATTALVIGVTACGAHTPPTQGMPAAVGARDPVTASASGAIEGIPVYQPSTVVSRTGSAVVLTSPDSVSKVTAFYVDAVDKGGWNSVSKSITNYSGTLTLGKPGHGAAISISPSGSGSMIAISTYTTP